ncbi:MAG: 23S rRNA (uracil(1939)-C(5))-methyltransferase [Candidatus Dactylopiibacterium carminicum]|uniref:23S rRNA (uracil(1939)-C(5))-methyltransferase RlmD n=1 Tax=Candidatus Dactylopiibacterium carminicum TaxID=857335 RepID=A0A272EPP1_9RHOO|nr:23S rRNA (uracil(1939)-C(5))-methyltransferase RlmD [Candidatus Dactylopiibacterium carminicum]KAF7599266.1 23S rRNA (uracil(1939)-C(5))-methyltransferase RlmD [Candidatus Dactylopiibacterium carminicum]PAS91660.1 MAG: 23S rRNA (uracil(1939)-C(5))-methyltransferase [Candidatus Dactylopiibacterium carminicum]PAS97183.1 MAG: 23S rRNA (uracil(1939)-C(5))-methyltransferase [Candidatus Dactylopiibacterium carminicum]PAS99274.1 MAG: 23S rRNA (uracil(1939)-C(5))-methyltransferase [Candidatus Dactyl
MTEVVVESLDHEGRGVAHNDGKVIFIEGALPGERVRYASYRRKPAYEQAVLDHVIRESSQRVLPRCPHFGVCGGCSMQHLEPLAQVAAKQRVLEDALWHIARVRPGVIYAAIHGPAWGYRDRARLSVRCVPSKGGVLVGFHEKKSSYIAEMDSCEILPPHVSALLRPLRSLIADLSIPDRIPQAEIAVCETKTVLVLRNLQPFTRQDEARLLAFGEARSLDMWFQPGGPETARPLRVGEPAWLEYRLPEFDVRLRFRPTDFTQVNVHINRLLMRRAMHLLAPAPGERIADLFCGLGNFSLPIAAIGAQVVGVEGSEALVARASENARLNGLEQRTRFLTSNLFETSEKSLAELGPLDKLLIDPPREGAIAVCKALGEQAPRRIVYVSCNLATLARDAAVLVYEKGYRLLGAGVANMFPQTSHVESIALFERA